MASNQDIMLSGNDLLITGGDFGIGISDPQHIADTMNAFPGWWKENPADGVGVFQYLNSSGQEQQLKRSVIIQMQADGYTASPDVTINSAGQIIINPGI